jgi:hypothetical protein
VCRTLWPSSAKPSAASLPRARHAQTARRRIGTFFWWYEFLVFTTYCPDLRQLRDKGVSIAVAAGAKSEDPNHVLSTFPQAGIMGCPRLVFPGNDAESEMEPEPFAEALLEACEMLERRKGKTKSVDSYWGILLGILGDCMHWR